MFSELLAEVPPESNILKRRAGRLELLLYPSYLGTVILKLYPTTLVRSVKTFFFS